MFKNFFLAVAIAMASQSFVFTQDVFWSFSSTSLETSFSGNLGDTGSAYIFSDANFGFDAIDLDFTMSDSRVIRFTGGEAFNPTFNVIGGRRFNAASVQVEPTADTPVGDTWNLFLVNVIENGVDPSVGRLFDPGFEPGVGPNGAFLLARIDFEILDVGGAELEFSLGLQGAIELPENVLDPTFGSAVVNTDGFTFILGDINNDGAVNFLDFSPFISVLANYQYQFTADCNQDGVVNFFDVGPFIAIVSSQ